MTKTVCKRAAKWYHIAMKERHFGCDIDREIARHEEGGGKLRLLLHVCCGPCAAGVLPRIAPHFDLTLFYYNPNILPKEEFIKRLDTLKCLLAHFPDVKLIVPEQDAAEFLAVAAGMETLREGGARCAACFGLRLGKTAEFAALHGGEYDAFATTLTVSPRKNAPLINDIGTRAAERAGVRYLTSDFKKHDGWLTSVRLCREWGLYRQHYCGCGFPDAVENDAGHRDSDRE